VRVVAAAIQAPDVVVRQIAHHLERLRILAEEMFACVRAAERLARLVFAVDSFHHQLAQHAVGVACEQRIPVAAPDDLDRVPAGAAEHAFEFLDDLAVTAHRTVEALQIAIYYKNQIIQFFASGQRDRAERFGLVGFAVADETPHLAVGRRNQPAVFQVLPEMRLIDRLQRTQAHRHGRHLPVVRHQPRMRIRGETTAFAGDFHAEQIHLVFGDAPFEKRARVDARARMALVENQVAGVAVARRAPEMIEADVVERRARGKARDMAAEFAGLAVRAHDHRHRIPADQAADAPFHGRIAGHLGFQMRRNRVDVFGGRRKRQVAAGTARRIDHALEQVMRAFRAVGVDDCAERIGPLARFGRVEVLIQDVIHDVHGLPLRAPGSGVRISFVVGSGQFT
jgi:hypothetical protein